MSNLVKGQPLYRIDYAAGSLLPGLIEVTYLRSLTVRKAWESTQMRYEVRSGLVGKKFRIVPDDYQITPEMAWLAYIGKCRQAIDRAETSLSDAQKALKGSREEFKRAHKMLDLLFRPSREKEQ